MLIRKSLALALLLAISTSLSADTITFQQGVGGYTGTYDRLISLNNSRDGGSVDTTGSSFFIDGDPQDASRADYLIRFDNIVGGSAIPDNAIILGASLSLTTTDSSVSSNSQTGESYSIYRLAVPFNSSSTLDGDFGDGNGVFTNNVDGAEIQQGEINYNVGTFDHAISDSQISPNQTATANVTRAVQSWVNGDTNLGLAIISDHVDNDDGWSVHSTGSSNVNARPLLTVEYTTDPTWKKFEFQQGVNGYTGTEDVVLRANSRGSLQGAFNTEVFLDGSNGTDSFDDPYLVRFDVSSLTGDTVEKAELTLKSGISSGSSDSGGPYTLHQMLTPFDPSSSQYEDFAGDVSAMILAGQIGPEVARFESIDEAELMDADITSIVQNWLDGDPNYGLYIGANGTSDGWQIFTSGAGNAGSPFAPLLTVITSGNAVGGGGPVPEPASLAVWGLLGVAAVMLRRRMKK